MLIQNAIIFNGTGEKNFVADIRIRNKKIVEIGKLHPTSSEQTLNVKGAFVTPGFVDILNHSDAYVTLFSNPSQESLLQQGITTILMGNCGSSLAPLTDGTFVNSLQKWGDISEFNVNWLSMKEYLTELEKHTFGVNLATLVGHSTVRRGLIGDEARNLTQKELDQLIHLIERGISEGAYGVSTGLAYAHGRHTSIKEIEALMNVAKKYKALYATHIRNESDEFANAFSETLDLAHKTGVNLEFSHLKVAGEAFWEQFDETLALLNKDNENINFDIYPYRTTASVLYTLLPYWASEGGKKNLLANIKNPKTRKRLVEEMKNDYRAYKDMIIAMGSIDKTYFGKSINQIAQNQNITPEEATLNMITASNNRIIVFTQTISEENVVKAIQHPKSFISSAGVGYQKKDATRGEFIHPRYFGALPKFFAEYIREQNLTSWEEAVYKVTLGPAEKIGLKKRGKIDKGYFADLVVFDPVTIKDRATFAHPYQYPQGIKYVIVNGEIAIEDEIFTGKMAGAILKK